MASKNTQTPQSNSKPVSQQYPQQYYQYPQPYYQYPQIPQPVHPGYPSPYPPQYPPPYQSPYPPQYPSQPYPLQQPYPYYVPTYGSQQSTQPVQPTKSHLTSVLETAAAIAGTVAVVAPLFAGSSSGGYQSSYTNSTSTSPTNVKIEEVD